MDILALAIIAFLGASGVVLFVRSTRRDALEVFSDLDSDIVRDGSLRTDRLDIQGRRVILGDELARAGLHDSAERRRYLVGRRVVPLAVAAVAVGCAQLSGIRAPGAITAIAAMALSSTYLAGRAALARRRRAYLVSLDRSLPLVMERIVMAVQSGHDIISALEVLDRLQSSDQERVDSDPVTPLLLLVKKLSEAGMSFDVALREVAELVESAPLRHAFIHLGLSHREGGELVAPLRELSDATQSFYQERIEEEIAALPVKATVPLLLLFLGLLLSFLTTPLFQITRMTSTIALPEER